MDDRGENGEIFLNIRKRNQRENKKEKPKSRVRKKQWFSGKTLLGGKKRTVVAAVGASGVLLAGLASYGAYGVYAMDTITSGVRFMGEDLQGKTVQDAAQTAEQKQEEVGNYTLRLYMGETERIIRLADIGGAIDTEKVAEDAQAVARSGNAAQNIWNFYACKWRNTDIPVTITYDADLLGNVINDFAIELDQPVVPTNCTIDYDNAVVYAQKGTDGSAINKEKLLADIEQTISNMNGKTSADVEVTSEIVSCEELTPQLVKEQVEHPAEDAVMVKDENGVDVVQPHVVGVQVDEATVQQVLDAGEQETYTIPVTLIQPEVVYNDLIAQMFLDTLGEYSSKFNAGNANRTHNIELAAQKINGTILNPGEEFSYNGVVGSRTAEAGFKEAGVFTAQGSDTGIGGGVCQVSSTLYVAAVYADLEIVERRNHSFTVGYVPDGWDATVYFGSIDFRFRNNQQYPVKVNAWVDGGTLHCSITGTKLDDKKVTIYSGSKYGYRSAGEDITYDSSMAEGKRVVTKSGINGFSIDTYKKVEVGGEVVSDGKLATSTYRTVNAKVTVGTKKATPAPQPSTSTPETSTSTEAPAEEAEQ